MPVKYVTGDIFEAPTQTLVNTVNTKGVMGKGLALAFKERFPDMFRDYRERCTQNEVHVGQPYLYTVSRPWILNFPTKDHWRYPSRLAWIRDGLEYFAGHYLAWGVTSAAFPQLGTLNGKLSWPQVHVVMDELLSDLDIEVLVYTVTLETSARRPGSSPDRSPEAQARLL